MRVMVVAFCVCRAVPLSPRTLSHLWLVGGGSGGHKWDKVCDKWDEVLARAGRSGGVAGGQWNWAVSVEPARARVALSGLSAVETTSK